MWMQQSMESASINSQGNLHNRNRFASSESQMHNSTNQNGDWKSKIMEGGQWLGGKVIAYGGKLARGGSHDTIPDHISSQLPRNDGRANWMADIRNSSSSYSNNGSYSNQMSGNTYQNDFVTERPQAYSDYASNNSSSSVPSASTPFGNAPRPYKDNDRESSRRVKKKSDNKKQEKKNKHKSQKSKKSKRQEVSSSEEESASESEESPTNDSEESVSETDSEKDDRRSKSKHKKHTKKRRDSFSSESEEDSLEQKKPSKQSTKVNRVKASADYSFSFDPSKLPPPPTDKDKHSKSSKKVSDKSTRTRRQSIESTDTEVSDKENQVSQSRGKKTSRVKAKNSVKKKDDASVDLLGVDLDTMTMVTSTPTSLPIGSEQVVQSNVFDQQLDPMQALAGLNFDASYSALPQPTPAFVAAHPASTNQPQDQQPQVPKTNVAPGTEFIKNLLPKNDIVDLDTLASTTTKKNENVCAAEKLSLNELQRQQPPQQQQPQMPVGNMYSAPMMSQQQQYAMMQQQQSGMPMNPMQMQQMQMQIQMQQHMMRQSMQYPSSQHMYSTPYQQQQFNNGGTYNPNQYTQHP